MRWTMRGMRSGIGSALLALALAGCGGHQNVETGVPPGPTTLEVDNESFNDMRIYVVQGGQRFRVGEVTGKNTAILKLPKSLLPGFTRLRVEAVPIGANGHSITEEISVEPGDKLSLRILP